MKKTIFILAAIILFAACKEKIVYVTKPTLNDSTVLKAEMKLVEWKAAFNTIQQKSVAMYYLKDTTEKKKAFDTIMMAINYIDKNIGDSNRNQIFKK
jgi:hypothetical protein